MPPERPPRKPARPAKAGERGKPPRTGERKRTDRKPTDRDRTKGADRWSKTDRGTPADRPRRTTGQAPKRAEPPRPAPKKWGNVARRGAASLGEDQATASRIWRDAVKRARDEPAPKGRPEGDWEPEVWKDERPARATVTRAAPPTPEKRGRKPRELTAEVAGELTAARGEKRGTRLQSRLTEAAGAFERGRYLDARRMLKPLADEAPGAASVRELYGLTLYHLDKWRDAARELEAFRSLTGSVEQHPVLADAYRALRRYKKVDELWEELRQASPGAELVAEGRIVAAGALADRGDVEGAIALLEKAKLDLKRPRVHTLRLLYALADLYERAGDMPKARDLFRRIVERDRDFFDAADRARALA